MDITNIISNNNTIFKQVLLYLNIEFNYVYVKNRINLPSYIGVTYLIIFTLPVQNTQPSLPFEKLHPLGVYFWFTPVYFGFARNLL